MPNIHDFNIIPENVLCKLLIAVDNSTLTSYHNNYQWETSGWRNEANTSANVHEMADACTRPPRCDKLSPGDLLSPGLSLSRPHEAHIKAQITLHLPNVIISESAAVLICPLLWPAFECSYEDTDARSDGSTWVRAFLTYLVIYNIS